MKRSLPPALKPSSVLDGFPIEAPATVPAAFPAGCRCAVLRPVRTDHARAVRRIHGDRGYCRFSDRYYLPSTSGCSNTITGVQKDNLLWIEKFL